MPKSEASLSLKLILANLFTGIALLFYIIFSNLLSALRPEALMPMWPIMALYRSRQCCRPSTLPSDIASQKVSKSSRGKNQPTNQVIIVRLLVFISSYSSYSTTDYIFINMTVFTRPKSSHPFYADKFVINTITMNPIKIRIPTFNQFYLKYRHNTGVRQIRVKIKWWVVRLPPVYFPVYFG